MQHVYHDLAAAGLLIQGPTGRPELAPVVLDTYRERGELDRDNTKKMVKVVHGAGLPTVEVEKAFMPKLGSDQAFEDNVQRLIDKFDPVLVVLVNLVTMKPDPRDNVRVVFFLSPLPWADRRQADEHIEMLAHNA